MDGSGDDDDGAGEITIKENRPQGSYVRDEQRKTSGHKARLAGGRRKKATLSVRPLLAMMRELCMGKSGSPPSLRTRAATLRLSAGRRPIRLLNGPGFRTLVRQFQDPSNPLWLPFSNTKRISSKKVVASPDRTHLSMNRRRHQAAFIF